MKKWVCGEFVQHIQHFFDKLLTETFAAAVVPRGNLNYVVFCSGREKTCQIIVLFAI